jgi:hypothetical protein
MKITVTRFHSDKDTTLSLVRIDGGLHCFGLEDEFREVKVMHETRIPAGIYPIKLRNAGGVTKRYAAKFRGDHKGMLHILNVPGFKWIYIHMGNTDDHTSGCLLVADSASVIHMVIRKSEYAYLSLYKKVVGSAEYGDLTIEFIDEDR